MGRRLSIAAAATTLLCACPADDPAGRDQYSISLQLDVGEVGSTCDSAPTCGQYAMGCDVRVGVRLLDLPPDPDNPTVAGAVRDTKCSVPNLSAGTLCELGDPEKFSPTFFRVSPTPGQIEIVVWPAIPETIGCPEVEFDLAGRPREDIAGPTRPAFGRRVYFDFGGQEPVARVPLACSNPGDLDSVICNPPTLDIHADLDDVALPKLGMGVDSAKAELLTVKVGKPVFEGGRWRIIPQDAIDLARVQDVPEVRPEWATSDVPAEIDGEPRFELNDDLCTLVLGLDSAPPTLTCSKLNDQAALDAGEIDLFGYMISGVDWERFEQAIGLESFPTEGLVLGRVVGTNLSPLDQVTVSHSGNPLVLYYLNENGDGIHSLAETSSSGYFVAQAPLFTTTWEAQRFGNWRVVGTPTGGVLGNSSITVVIITMSQDIDP
jgi:hypothetical protein